jgi:hypothetical protein
MEERGGEEDMIVCARACVCAVAMTHVGQTGV